MNIGKLRHRVTIEQLIVEQDSDGAQIESWVNPFGMDLWAEIQPLSGRELIASQSLQSEVKARIIIRYRDGVVPTMRVLHRGNIYNIAAVIPDIKTGKEYLTLQVTYGVNEG